MSAILPEEIQEILRKIFNQTKPVSIFLYGSFAQGDPVVDSDYEIGVIYSQNNKVSRSHLATFHQLKNLKIYPFSLEDLQNHRLDTPFPQSLYLLQLLDNAQTIFGENVFKNITRPIISSGDLIESVAFSLGRAYAAVVSSRQNDTIAVVDNFTKSFFYGLQILVFIKSKKLVYSYRELKNDLDQLNIPQDYQPLIDHVFSVRDRKISPDNNFLFKNISFLNTFVMPLAKTYS